MKTIVMTVLCAGLLLTVSCGKPDDKAKAKPEGPITLTIATSLYVEEPHQKALDQLIAAYKNVKPNVEIKVYGSNYDNFWDNLTTEILAGNEADITQMYQENIGRYHSLRLDGTFLPLDKYIRGTPYEKMTAQKYCEYKGQYLAFSSYGTSTTAMFYRKSLLQKAGVNPAEIKTMDDLRSASKKLTKDGVFAQGFVIAAHPFCVSEWSRIIARPVSKGIYFKNNEGEPYTPETINCNSEENIWAAKWWRDVYAADKTARAVNNKKATRELFWNGEVAMSHDGAWFIGMTEARDPELMKDVDVFPLPSVNYNGANYQANPTLYAVVSLVSKKCKNPDAAWDFLSWMTTDEAQKIIEVSGMVPANPDYVEKSNYSGRNPLSYKIYSFMNDFYAGVLVSDPAIPEQGELQQIMIDAAQNIFANGGDAKKVLDAAAEKMKAVMKP